ncbi:MAG: lysostaphin resistance A-like protein [bacterium]
MNHWIDNQEPVHPNLKVIVGLIFIGMIIATLITLGSRSVLPEFQLFFGEIFIIVPAVTYIKFKKYNFRDVFRLYKVDKNVVLVSTVLAVSLTILSDEIDRIVSNFVEIPPEFEELISKMLIADTFIEWINLFVTAVILAGIIEEMLFRGLLQKALERKVEVPYAIFFSALFFALVHLAPWLIQVLILGMILGYLAWRSNSIFPSIILHCMNNAYALILTNVNPTNLKWYTWNGHVYPPILALAACITFYGFKWFFRSTDKEEDVHQY